MIKPDKQHPQYVAYKPVWKKCRDASDGQRAIHAGKELYLKKLSEQEDPEYDAYLDRASYFNATGRTVEAMAGFVFRKPLKADVPDVMKLWLEDITLADESITDLAQTAITENIITGRGGFLVEMPINTDKNMTVADKEALAIRPYLVLYQTESIINWEYKRLNNVYQLVNVWLTEAYQDDTGEEKEQIRELTIASGLYQQVIWRTKEKGADWHIEETITPTKSGQPITVIPFFPFSPKKTKIDIAVPPIESLADVNISHYKNSADIENGAHIAGLPTAYVTGMDGQIDESGNLVTGEPIYLGSSTILSLPKDATAGFLQCGNEGFATIEKLMDRKEQQMAALGARMLSPEKKQAEASETHEIKRGAENSVLATLAGVVERQLNKALQFAAEWEGIPGEISIELNKDYFPVTFTAQDLTAWTATMQSGSISKETYFDILQYSEWLPDGLTYEEEQDRISNDPPALGLIEEKPANDNG
jgi:hypothetical protein